MLLSSVQEVINVGTFGPGAETAAGYFLRYGAVNGRRIRIKEPLA